MFGAIRFCSWDFAALTLLVGMAIAYGIWKHKKSKEDRYSKDESLNN